MTTVNRNSPAATAPTAPSPGTNMTVEPAGEALACPVQVDTLERPTSVSVRAMGLAEPTPPIAPSLKDESRASCDEERQAIRDSNRQLIQAYGTAYDAYLKSYAGLVAQAPTMDSVRRLPGPVAYDPTRSLPIPQRRIYDTGLAPARVQTQRVVYEAVTERSRKESGKAMPGVYAFFEGKAGFMGQTVSGRVEGSEAGVKTKTTLGYGVSSAMTGDPSLLMVKDVPGVVGLRAEVDPDTGAWVQSVSARFGGVGVEANSNGKVSYTVGLDEKVDAFGAELKGSLAAGSSFDGKKARTEVFGKAGAKLGDLGEIEVKAGAGVQLLSGEYVEDVVDPSDRGTFGTLDALRTGGR